MPSPNSFGARAPLGHGLPDLYRLDALAAAGLPLGLDLGRAPMTLKILLENALRHAGGGIVREQDVATLAAWRPGLSVEAHPERQPGLGQGVEAIQVGEAGAEGGAGAEGVVHGHALISAVGTGR